MLIFVILYAIDCIQRVSEQILRLLWYLQLKVKQNGGILKYVLNMDIPNQLFTAIFLQWQGFVCLW